MGFIDSELAGTGFLRLVQLVEPASRMSHRPAATLNQGALVPCLVGRVGDSPQGGHVRGIGARRVGCVRRLGWEGRLRPRAASGGAIGDGGVEGAAEPL